MTYFSDLAAKIVKRSPSVVAEEDGDALLPSLCAANFLITFESKDATATGGKQIKPTVSLGTFGSNPQLRLNRKLTTIIRWYQTIY